MQAFNGRAHDSLTPYLRRDVRGVHPSPSHYQSYLKSALVQSLWRENPRLRWVPAYQVTTIGGQFGVTATMSNVSAVTGRFEYMSVSTAHLSDGNLLYIIGIAPADEAGTYRQAFERVLESIQIIE